MKHYESAEPHFDGMALQDSTGGPSKTTKQFDRRSSDFRLSSSRDQEDCHTRPPYDVGRRPFSLALFQDACQNPHAVAGRRPSLLPASSLRGQPSLLSSATSCSPVSHFSPTLLRTSSLLLPAFHFTQASSSIPLSCPRCLTTCLQACKTCSLCW